MHCDLLLDVSLCVFHLIKPELMSFEPRIVPNHPFINPACLITEGLNVGR
jgi:hypothetical protein